MVVDPCNKYRTSSSLRLVISGAKGGTCPTRDFAQCVCIERKSQEAAQDKKLLPKGE